MASTWANHGNSMEFIILFARSKWLKAHYRMLELTELIIGQNSGIWGCATMQEMARNGVSKNPIQNEKMVAFSSKVRGLCNALLVSFEWPGTRATAR